ncbi:MAG: translation initiation factor Sui1 [Methylotetracoccus sp.]
MSRIVYSTEHGRMCPECGKPVAGCVCKTAKARAATKAGGPVRVGRQTQGRRGKGVTVITGLPCDADALKALATELKGRCGTGGTVKDGIIEIQGDHRDLLVEELRRRGWDAKRSGG